MTISGYRGHMASSIRLPYDMWPQYNRRLREVIAAMSAEQLAIRPAAEGWPVWATVAHTAGARVYWLCEVVGEPGIESTPFRDLASGIGWEDDLEHPRDAAHGLPVGAGRTLQLMRSMQGAMYGALWVANLAAKWNPNGIR